MDSGWMVMIGLALMVSAGWLIALLKGIWDILGWVHWVIFPFVITAIAALWVGGAILFIGGLFDT